MPAATFVALASCGNPGHGEDEMSSKPSALSASGLSLQFSLDEGAGTVASDARGGPAGALSPTGVSWTSRPGGGQALAFTNGVVRVPVSPALDGIAGQITVAAWVRVDQKSANWSIAVSRQEATDHPEVFGLGLDPAGHPMFLLSDFVPIAAASVAPLGVWIHLAGTYDGQTSRLYVDGELVAEEPRESDVRWVSTRPLLIGNNNNVSGDAPSEPWRGAIDDVRIYSRALSGEELSQPLDPTDPGCVAPTVLEAARTTQGTGTVTATLPAPLGVAIPASLPVTYGNAGNGEARLILRAPDNSNTVCRYRGGADELEPTSSDQRALGMRFILESCDGGLKAGQRKLANRLTLEVLSGDPRIRPTSTRFVVADARCPRPVPRPASASDPFGMPVRSPTELPPGSAPQGTAPRVTPGTPTPPNPFVAPPLAVDPNAGRP